MTWVKIDDGAPLHPKLLAAGIDAVGLWVAGLCHCNRHATDGLIEGAMIGALYPSALFPRWRATRVARKLVAANLWTLDGNNYRVVNYERYQSEATAAKQRERRDEAARRQRQKRERDRVPSNVVQLGRMSRCDAPVTSHDPVPSRPDQSDLASLAHSADRISLSLAPIPPEPPLAAESREGREGAEPPAAGELTPAEMWRTFAGAWQARKSTFPSAGGQHVGELHGRVLATAAAQNIDPRTLFALTVARYVGREHSKIELRAPYACFAAAWGELTARNNVVDAAALIAEGRAATLEAQARARAAEVCGVRV